MKQSILIRKFEERDAKEVSELIITTLRTTNSRDYPAVYIENTIKQMAPKNILEKAMWTHFYVACDHEVIVGCGAIGAYWGKEDESSLFSIFVLPEYQGQGIGRMIIEMLEQDELFLRAKRIEVPSSVTGVGFYKKLGYTPKHDVDIPDDEGLVRLEKYR